MMRRTVWFTISVLALHAASVVAAADESARATQLPSRSLKQVVGDRFKIGVGVGHLVLENPADASLVCEQFQILTPENCMKPQGIHPAEDVWRFDAPDRFVAFAREHDLDVVGHCLVWAKDDRTDAWMMEEGGKPVSRETLLRRIESHIATVVGRYKDQVTMWDVVNEAIGDSDDGLLRDSVYSRTTDLDFLVTAFQAARAADPDALLIYNDYNGHKPGKREKLLELLRRLKAAGAPVDAYGMQGHFELGDNSIPQLRETFDELRAMGLKVVVSELDIDVVKRGRWWADGGAHRDELASYDPYHDGLPVALERQLAEEYAALFRLFLDYDDIIERVSFWNVHDGHSWLNDFPWKRVNHPLLFDRAGKPKPAFDAVYAVLANEWPYRPELLRPFWAGDVVEGESVLFVRDEGAETARASVLFPISEVIAVRNSAGDVTYEEGRDYVVAPGSREMVLPAGSRIVSTAVADLRRPAGTQKYALTHRDGNGEILFGAGLEYASMQTCITYRREQEKWKSAYPTFDPARLPRSVARLATQQPLSIVTLGDSISEGANASGMYNAAPFQPAYPELVRRHLAERSGGEVQMTNLSVGGMDSAWGMTQVDKVVAAKPDLVILAFGMNDSAGRSAASYKENIAWTIAAIREKVPECEFILVATMLGNRDWTRLKQEAFGEYRAALGELARPGVAVADLTTIWEGFLERKHDWDQTGNGVNHPNDFGHRVYAQVITTLLGDGGREGGHATKSSAAGR